MRFTLYLQEGDFGLLGERKALVLLDGGCCLQNLCSLFTRSTSLFHSLPPVPTSAFSLPCSLDSFFPHRLIVFPEVNLLTLNLIYWQHSAFKSHFSLCQSTWSWKASHKREVNCKMGWLHFHLLCYLSCPGLFEWFAHLAQHCISVLAATGVNIAAAWRKR